MGVSREDLVYNIARHVDSTVHLFEKWGLPIWKDENGKYVREGRWQIMINGESYKVIVAEAAKKRSGYGSTFTSACSSSIRSWMVIALPAPLASAHVKKSSTYSRAKAVLAAMGGAVHVFRPAVRW